MQEMQIIWDIKNIWNMKNIENNEIPSSMSACNNLKNDKHRRLPAEIRWVIINQWP